MAELTYIFREKYPDTFDTLKNTSYDKDNNVFMCESSMQVVDFDSVTKKLYSTKQPSSYDALLIEEDISSIFCVEFKNQKYADIKNQNIRKKVIDSTTTLQKIYKENSISKRQYTNKLCIVYKRDETQYKYRRFKENIVRFGLEDFIGKGIDSVITNNILFFQREFQKKYGCETRSQING